MRLTNKNENGEYVLSKELCNPKTEVIIVAKEITNKLGQLENIEEEFEIDDFEDLRDRLNAYKFLANHEMSCVDVNAYNIMLNDLEEYHKIEEELGVDLITFFKYLSAKEVFFTDDFNEIQRAIVRSANKKGLIVFEEAFSWGECDFTLYFKDYGKTWALTKEELEK